jgi:hypothetical protein
LNHGRRRDDRVLTADASAPANLPSRSLVMRKVALILAGAVAFDLGVVVLAGQAAEPAGGASASGPAGLPTASGEHFIKVQKTGVKLQDIHFAFLRIDSGNTAAACVMNGGTVVAREGKSFCKVPSTPGSDKR